VPEPAAWVEKTPRFWYRRSVKGGSEFVLVEAATAERRPAFDHEKLAAALTTALTPEKPYTGITLPFTTFSFVDAERAIEITVNNATWRCVLEDSRCRTDPAAGRGRRRGRGGRGGGLEGPVRASSTSTAGQKRPTASRSAGPQLQRRDPRDGKDRGRSSASTDRKAATRSQLLVWSPDPRR
jgi:hypothetical protein